MILQPWEVLVVACTAMGLLALGGRHALRLWGQRQIDRLARESGSLQRWWSVLGEVPESCLDAPVRRAIGSVLYRRLEWARRIQPNHPFLRTQRLQIARFIAAKPPLHAGPQTREERQRTIDALGTLLEMLQQAGDEHLIHGSELVTAEAGVSRRLTELEFVQRQHASLQADYLRRVTRAIGPQSSPWTQLNRSSRALPTQ